MRNMQSSSVENTALASEFTAADVLKAGIERGCLESLVAMLKKHSVTSIHSKALLSLLQALGVDFSVAYAALSDTKKRHCLRCHETYQECTNGPEVCVIKLTHRRDGWVPRNEDYRLEEDQGKTETMEIGYWHTAESEDLLYPWLVDQCEQLGCDKVE